MATDTTPTLHLSIQGLLAQASLTQPLSLTDKWGRTIPFALQTLREVMEPSTNPALAASVRQIDWLGGPPLPIRENIPATFFTHAPVASGAQNKHMRLQLQHHRHGRVILKNFKPQGQHAEKTKAILHGIHTEADMLSTIFDSITSVIHDSTKAKSKKTFVSQIGVWMDFCVAIGVAPFRFHWFLRNDISATQLAQEDGLWQGFAAYLRVRFSSFGSVTGTLSAVKSFHEKFLFLPQPDFAISRRFLKMVKKVMARDNPIRRRRDNLTPKQLRSVQCHWERLATECGDTADQQAQKAFWSTLQAILAAAFGQAFRIGELAVGSEFDSEKAPNPHWTRQSIQQASTLREGQVLILSPPERKTEFVSQVMNEQARQPWPWKLTSGDKLNFMFQCRKLLARLPVDEAQRIKLPAFFDPRAAPFKAISPSVFRDELRTAVEAALPAAEANRIVVGDHSIKRSTIAAWNAAGLDAATRNAALGFAPDSSSSGRYDKARQNALLAAQAKASTVEIQLELEPGDIMGAESSNSSEESEDDADIAAATGARSERGTKRKIR